MIERLRHHMWRFTLARLVNDREVIEESRRAMVGCYDDDERNAEYKRCQVCLELLKMLTTAPTEAEQQRHARELAQSYTMVEINEAGHALQVAGVLE